MLSVRKALRSRGEEGREPPQISLLICLFLMVIPLNVLFLKEVTNNKHENQQAKSREN